MVQRCLLVAMLDTLLVVYLDFKSYLVDVKSEQSLLDQSRVLRAILREWNVSGSTRHREGGILILRLDVLVLAVVIAGTR